MAHPSAAQPESEPQERELPLCWTPAIAASAREWDFNLTLQLLGGIMVAFNHLEHRFYQALSHLINEHDYLRGEATLRYVRGLDNQLALFRGLFAMKNSNIQAQKELARLTAAIKENSKKRNVFAHSRLLLPTKHMDAVAIRLKTDDMSNVSHPVTLDELKETVKSLDTCGQELLAFCENFLPDYRKGRVDAFFKAVISGEISLDLEET
jgi:hypothetical protein